MGDLLFAIANLSRKLGVEPESALRRANDKFARRFEAMERAFAAQGRSLRDASLDEMEAEWQRVKSGEPAPSRRRPGRGVTPRQRSPRGAPVAYARR